MSNYPPGVTGNEPEITGVEHLEECPLSEDFEFSDEDYKRIDPYDVRDLVQAIYSFRPPPVHPFLWLTLCRCDELRQETRQDALLAKWEAKREDARL